MKKHGSNKNKRLVKPNAKKTAFKYGVAGVITYFAIAMLVTGCLFIAYIEITGMKDDDYMSQIGDQVQGLPLNNNTSDIEKLRKWYNTPLLANISSDEELLEIQRSALSYHLKLETFAYSGTAIVYDVTNGKEYVRTEDGIYLTLGQNSGDERLARFYFLNDEDAPELYEDYLTEFSNSKDLVPDIYYENVYLSKDGCFIPGKCKLIHNEKGDENDSVVAEYDYTPSNTEDYVEIFPEQELDDSGKIFVFGQPVCFESSDISNANKSKCSARMMTELEKMLEENIKNSDDGPLATYDFCRKIGFGTVEYYTVDPVDNSQLDREYSVAYAIHCSMWQDWKLGLLIGYGAGFVVLFILFIILGLRSYQKSKIYYETENFRRSKTNAMAHDLKTPLTAISGYVEMLESDASPEKKQHYLDEMKKTTTYMNSMIEKNLELNKLDSGEVGINLTDFDFKAECESVISIYQSQLDEGKLTVSVTGSLIAKADEKLMQSAIQNLIENAVKYAKPGTEIVINMSEKEISFTNEIEHELENPDVNSLKAAYTRDSKSREGKQGNGLGLSIVDAIVNQHGYAFELESKDMKFKACIKL